MPIEMIDSIAKDFFKKISAMRIGGSSLEEQMTSPYFNYFLSRLKECNADVELITNGTLITKESAKLIVSSISSIYISVEAIGKNYETIRRSKWEHLEKIINLLMEERNKLNKIKPVIICFAITVMRDFREDYFKLAKFAKDHQMDLLMVRDLFPIKQVDRKSSFLFFEEEHNEFFSELERYVDDLGVAIIRPASIPREKTKRNIFVREKCSQPFEIFGVQPDGEITPCCRQPISLGYYRSGEERVAESWRSKKFIYLRKRVNSNNPLPKCRNCEMCNYNPLSYINHNLKHRINKIFTGRICYKSNNTL